MKTLPWEDINGAAVIRASGSFTASVLPKLEHTVHALAGRAPALIVLDCVLISDVDAAVIAFLLRSSNRLKKRNITFALCNPSREIMRKLEILNVCKCLTILADKAISDFGGTPRESRPTRKFMPAEQARMN
ncbi:MAG TPA: STAS domain-containing protein [Spirochaetota bacterium]|nr:STAS domain-containing protein [Spirochaetota bacterium]HPC39726.1 STAS domain-containing protein [Spirochaetota bacterium]HPL16806.1 STAS domain-containing protein [Spirochaetota bacterium]HQJ69914.1 STAS domain-containing protein [Spirochaetota bacterium]HRS76371.1 STAS domain-containing protein [Spirochaetota bacterium]